MSSEPHAALQNVHRKAVAYVAILRQQTIRFICMYRLAGIFLRGGINFRDRIGSARSMRTYKLFRCVVHGYVHSCSSMMSTMTVICWPCRKAERGPHN